MEKIERIIWNGSVKVYIIRSAYNPVRTSFASPQTANLQVGHIVYPAGSVVPKHLHKKIIRRLDRTEEVLIVKKGSCFLDIYNERKKLVVTRKVRRGDIIIIVGGGHGFRVLKDLILLEIKQGPYTGIEEKERF